MSCITEILKLKGDNEILPLHDECVIEGGSTYKGHEFLITFTSHGTRCGYVALTQEQTQHFESERNNDQYYYPDIECHGGVTFYGSDHGAKNLLSIPCADSWIGFDCAHAGDGHSKELTEKYFNRQTFSDDYYQAMDIFSLKGEVVHRTYDYVVQECHNIIDQLIEVAA